MFTIFSQIMHFIVVINKYIGFSFRDFMGDDDYQLVPKNAIQDLKDENKKLKEEIQALKEQGPTNSNIDISEHLSELTSIIQEENKKERELVMHNLNEIKELNKSTLDNLLERTESLDDRLESMVGTISELINTSKELINEISSNNNHSDEDPVLAQIKQMLFSMNNMNEMESNNIHQKLEDIEIFMKNLKTLLSYVKPSSDFVLGNNNQNSSNSTPNSMGGLGNNNMPPPQ